MKNPMRPLDPAEVSWIIEQKIKNVPQEVPEVKKLEPWPWPKSPETTQSPKVLTLKGSE